MIHFAWAERMGLVFVGSAVGCLLIGQQVIRGLVGLKWIQPTRYGDCPPLESYQQTKQGTPTMGGLLVIGVAIAIAAASGGLTHVSGWLLLGAMAGMGAIGLLDDLLKLHHPSATGLRCAPKLVAALIVGAVIGALLSDPALGYRQVVVPWTHARVELHWVWIPYTCAVIAGCAHAVNLTDGMDGLAVGCLAVAFGVLGLLALAGLPSGVDPLDTGPGVAAIWCAGLAGACVGFLWFNSFPASVFLGDVGALSLGAALGTLALLTQTALILLVIGGIFVAEAISVMLQVASYRWRNRRRIFRVAPLHHHFHLGGVSEHKLVVRFWIVGLLLAALGLTAFSRS